jgi:hypothetical protein
LSKKKKEEKLWEWNVDYSGIDALKDDKKLIDAQGQVLTEEIVVDLVRKSNAPPRPAMLPPTPNADYKNMYPGVHRRHDPDLMAVDDRVSRMEQYFNEVTNRLVTVAEQQSDEIDQLKAELRELKGLLSSTLKIARKGVGF